MVWAPIAIRGPVFGLRAWTPFVFRGPVFGLSLSSAGLFLHFLCLPRACLWTAFPLWVCFRSLCLLLQACFWAPFVFRHGLVFVLSLSSTFFHYVPSVCFWALVFGPPLASGALFWTSSGFRELVLGPLASGCRFGVPLASGRSFLDLLHGFQRGSSYQVFHVTGGNTIDTILQRRGQA